MSEIKIYKSKLPSISCQLERSNIIFSWWNDDPLVVAAGSNGIQEPRPIAPFIKISIDLADESSADGTKDKNRCRQYTAVASILDIKPPTDSDQIYKQISIPPVTIEAQGEKELLILDISRVMKAFFCDYPALETQYLGGAANYRFILSSI